LILLDSDVLIEFLKGNPETYKIISCINPSDMAISSVTFMEILYGAFNKKEILKIKTILSNYSIIHINEEISAKALDLIEKYSKSNNLHIPDALIASTALYYQLELLTYNLKDFRYIEGLKLCKY